MKLRYLGTAAAEGFPAVFCNCKYCQEARALKGKNIRTRSQAIINDDLLIDLPADTYYHFLQNGIEGDKIKYLIVTHSHPDHFYYDELEMRSDGFSHSRREEKLEIFCGEGTYKIFEELGIYDNLKVTKLMPFKKQQMGSYRVTPLPARHMQGDGAFFYIIEQGKTVLYAHDTGYFFEEVFEYIKDNKIHFDMISFDCTNVDIPIWDEGGHMGIANIERVIERLEANGSISANTKLYINHFSHNANPLHHVLEKRVEGTRLNVSYDGCLVEI